MKLNPDNNVGVQRGLDILTNGMSSPFIVYHTKQAIVTQLHILGLCLIEKRALSHENASKGTKVVEAGSTDNERQDEPRCQLT